MSINYVDLAKRTCFANCGDYNRGVWNKALSDFWCNAKFS